MAEVPRAPGPPPHDAAATVLRARLMREDARHARERNRRLLRANEELLERVRRLRAARPDPEPER